MGIRMLGEESTLYLLIIDKVHFTKDGKVGPEVLTNIEFRWTMKRPENTRTLMQPSPDGQTPGVQTLVSHVRPLDVDKVGLRFIAKLSTADRRAFLLLLGQMTTLSYMLGQQAWHNSIRRVVTHLDLGDREQALIDKIVEELLPQIQQLDRLDMFR